MEWFGIFLIIVVVLVINGVIAMKFADIAGMKGHDVSPYFWYTFLLGIVGMLMVVALPDINTPKTGTQSPSQASGQTFSRFESPSYHSVSAPKPGTWSCTCGRTHQNYESSCICGVKKVSLKKTSDN